ncbi:DUF6418 domain-containing protein [Enterobacter cloacae]|uniref:DUF6418 domain-containing protein n=2 Tax=Enterobacter cloacae TaxID=550 RepID=UPI000F837A66|nr:DUF6418 domain-containing protein [Enterobacter cloacae]MCQ4409430.1 DUF6418 domain-containing protein [Enterobacter cloacae]MDV0894129.1 DUF6418 domain-containing protein [Enterobacter cloacae]MDV1084564.1 DUF6418 domain-containing protein [Enterobacter cloacae]RTP06769.1 hypothetical protein EKN55_17620 [Enterobacter cloacae]RUO02873.1 hypothetical protein EKN31_17615 [Enterobacter cloacae]
MGIAFICGLWICIIVANIVFSDGSAIINYCSIFLWLSTCIYFIRKNYSYGILSAQVMLAFTTAGICCAIAESGQWLSEVKYYSSLSGATARIMSLCFVIFFFSFFTFKYLSRMRSVRFGMSNKFNKVLLNCVVIAFFAFTVTLFIVHVIYGHPNDYGVDRYYYWANIAPKWAEYVKFLLSQFTVFIGLAYGLSRKKRYVILFVVSLLAQFSVGDKFSGMLYATMTFIIPIVILLKVNIGKLIFSARFVFISVIFVTAMMSASYLSYVAISGAGNGIDRLVDRIVLQGQMWWALDNSSNMSSKGLEEIMSNFIGIGNSDEFSTGIFYLMSIISPPSIFQWFADKGITMTMGSPVNLIYFFGFPLSVVPAAILGIIVGAGYHIFYRAILISDVILIFFGVKIMDSIFRAVTMGEIFYLFSLKVLAGLFAFVFYMLASWATTHRGVKAA